MTDATVTQVDREAAAYILRQSYVYETAAVEVEAGRWDTHKLVQAYARHRLAGTSGAVQEGSVLVPGEPTEAMLQAGVRAWLGISSGWPPEWCDYVARTYSAMLAAAPAAPSEGSVLREAAES